METKIINGFDYTITSTGHIIGKYGTLLTPRIENGYFRVDLYKDGKCYHKYVHRLVAENFIECLDDSFVVNHIDGNKLNNHVDNLEWCSYQYNIIHSFKLGLSPKDEDRSFSKLTFEIADKIRDEYKSSKKISQRNLAKKYGVSQRLILDVLQNKRWVKNAN